VTLAMAGAVLVALSPRSAAAWQLEVSVAGSRSTLNEASTDNRQAGLGATASARYARPGWGVEGTVAWQSLSPSVDDSRTSVTFMGGSVRGHYAVWRSLAAEIGLDSRTADPEFSAQDVAALMVGLRYETRLAAPAAVWLRGGAIPKAWLSGGGDAGIGVDLGFGVRVRAPESRWGLAAEYEFQRIDRTVQGNSVPLQFERVRLGVLFRPF